MLDEIILTLERRWKDLFAGLMKEGTLPPKEAMELFREIISLYSQPHRHYHDLRHIRECLDELRHVETAAHGPHAVEMALWYHDAVYDTAARDNEEESALLAESRLTGLNLPLDLIKKVSNLILATKHIMLPKEAAHRLMVDIDLSILGKSWERYDEYRKAIREEYASIDDSIFTPARRGILESFLARPVIFQTDGFRDKYETKARRNMKRELTILGTMVSRKGA